MFQKFNAKIRTTEKKALQLNFIGNKYCKTRFNDQNDSISTGWKHISTSSAETDSKQKMTSSANPQKLHNIGLWVTNYRSVQCIKCTYQNLVWSTKNNSLTIINIQPWSELRSTTFIWENILNSPYFTEKSLAHIQVNMNRKYASLSSWLMSQHIRSLSLQIQKQWV